MSIISLLVPVTMLADRLFIGNRAGSRAVSIYVVPYNLVSRALALPASLSSASLPKLAGAERNEEQALLTLGLRLLLATLMPICIAGNVLMAPFLHFWVGSSVPIVAATVGSILIFGFWMHGVGHIPSTVLFGRGRPDMVAKLYIAYVIVYFPILLVLLDEFGLPGAAIAWSIRASFDLSLFWWARTTRRDALHTGLCTLLVFTSSLAATLLDWHEPVYWAALLGILLVSLVAGYWLIPPETRKRAWELLRVRLAPAGTGDVSL
jgi:O-antigen/teichoic acid export membrane protein